MLLRDSSERTLSIAVQILREGGLVVFPTDTVYGIGCDLWQPRAIDRLYLAKRRPRELAIPVLVSSLEAINSVARDIPPQLERLAERFWPGGLTLVVPRRPELPEALCAGKDTVAIRMPAHAFALALIEAMGGALAVTSANLSGEPAPRTVNEAMADLEADLYVDGGSCPEGVASTIVDLSVEPPCLLRRGAIEFDRVRAVLPSLVE